MCYIINTDTLKSCTLPIFTLQWSMGYFWGGNSSNSKKIFTLQKKTVRLMAGVKSTNSCTSLFKNERSYLFHIFSLILLIVNNQEHSQTNSAVHSVNTRNINQLHSSIANLPSVQNCLLYWHKKFCIQRRLGFNKFQSQAWTTVLNMK
jgi:hypothetical protein